MPDSQRKNRQRGRALPAETLVETAIGAASQCLAALPGSTLESHMAGDWNELGLNVSVPDGSSDDDIVALGNRLLEAVSAAAATPGFPCGWIVGIYRGGELVTVVEPRSTPRRRCSLCGNAQATLLGDVCLRCNSPLGS